VSAAPGAAWTVVTTVSDPFGPRALVRHPPFPSAVPILSAVVASAGPDRVVHLRLRCSDHPRAGAFLTDRGSRPLRLTVQMRTHATGNGYVVLRLEAGGEETVAGGEGEVGSPTLEIAFDPVIHAPVIRSILDVGRVHLTDASSDAAAAGGWTVTVDRAAVRRMTGAALTHPRRVRLRLGSATPG
jgi:hypothetical protein